MTTENLRSHVVTCVILACASAAVNLFAFRLNSWGIWTSNTRYGGSCLPLPPPIGCAGSHEKREVLHSGDTDFAWICVANSGIVASAAVLALCLLGSGEKELFGLEEKGIKKALFMSFAASGVLNVLTCVIASFRINVSALMQRRQGLFGIGGLTPTYSMSFYLACINTIITLIGTFISYVYLYHDPNVVFNLVKTEKQHMARNFMYPDDQRATKMVTFSSMHPEMEESAAEIAVKAVMNCQMEEDIAENIKQCFEQQYGPTWHCAVGSCFGSAVEHRTDEYIEISMPQYSVLLFRCNEPPVTIFPNCGAICGEQSQKQQNG